jgi:transcriptional regulator with XRE-family HTH domain
MKTYSLEELTDKHIGKKGTKEREAFENELRLDLLGYAIKKARKERKLTQEQLGELVGVKKAQISKIENSTTDARFSTIMKVFEVLGAKVKFNVELNNQRLAYYLGQKYRTPNIGYTLGVYSGDDGPVIPDHSGPLFTGIIGPLSFCN